MSKFAPPVEPRATYFDRILWRYKLRLTLAVTIAAWPTVAVLRSGDNLPITQTERATPSGILLD
jgi:hypothetical protein